jgi:hypothetical protein
VPSIAPSVSSPKTAVSGYPIVGCGLGGVLGVLFAVPTLAVLKVLFDFLRYRLRTDPADERSRVLQATADRLSVEEKASPADPG